jgi:hypothetical protein
MKRSQEMASVTVKKSGKGKMMKGKKIKHMTIMPSDNGGFSSTTQYEPTGKQEPWEGESENNVHATPADMHAHVMATFPAQASEDSGAAPGAAEPDQDDTE